MRVISIGSSVVLMGTLVTVAAFAVWSRAQDGQANAAFTVLYQTNIRSIKTGNTLSMRYVEAHRTDRSTMEPLQDNKFAVRRVLLVPEKKEVQVGDALGMKSTLDYSAAYAAQSRTSSGPSQIVRSRCAPNPNIQADYVGEDTVFGVADFGYRRVNVDSDGTSEVIETWYAPELSCFPLKVDSQLKSPSGAVIGVFERRTVKITLGEPDSKLFDIPATYTEVQPSIMLKQLTLEQMSTDGATDESKTSAITRMQKYCDREDRKYSMYPPRVGP
jgi:hypothetical protein